MTKIVNLADAKARLSELVSEAASGTDIVIARRDVPIVRLVAVTPTDAGTGRRLGTCRGLIEMSDDFDALPEDFDAYR